MLGKSLSITYNQSKTATLTPQKLFNSSKFHKKAGQGYAGPHSIHTFTVTDDHNAVTKSESSNSKDSCYILSNINTFI